MVEATCESCGDTGETLVEVHRLYITPEAWDTAGQVDEVAETEHWCFVCRTHYPHRVVAPR